ncbi:hypothetical protein F53441_3598 [Fusarium austroafricanum]|uniref:Uncharacterized protein n=1 Tax=Fusarium austroafricanum TaxID=2364996 RepID=A0A8H4KMA6_9HYPO|nr:hypothetical protein F53441_3598 [Fusarium austroafricanum]
MLLGKTFKAVRSGPSICRPLRSSFALRPLRFPPAMSIHTFSSPNYSRVEVRSFRDVERLYHLLKSFMQEPARAKAVEEVVIDTYDWRQATWPLLDPEKVPESMGFEEILDQPDIKLRKYAGRLDLDAELHKQVIESLDWKRNQHDLRIRNESEFASAMIILLFALCENISTLYLSEYLYQKSVLDYLLRGNYGQMTKLPLQKLKNVRFITSPWTDDRYYGTIEILQYLQLVHRLPALESVAMDAIQEYQANRTFFVPGTGNMKRMEITHCDISGPFLAVMLSIPKALEELKLSIGGLWSSDGGQPLIRPFHVGQALYAHRNSLRVLDVDLDMAVQDTGDSYWDPKEQDSHDKDEPNWLVNDEYDEYGRDRMALDKAISVEPEKSDKEYGRTIGSLHDFPHLTHLSIGIITLLGSHEDWEVPNRLFKPAPFRLVDGLPSSLEYLCIYGYVQGRNPDVDGHIDELLAQKDEKLPQLKVIKGVDEYLPSSRDTFGHGDRPDEDELYVRKAFDLGWKEVKET